MLFDLLGMWFLESGIVGVLNSPFIVPVTGCLMILGISATSIWARVRSQEMKSQERLARIAHGLPVEPDWHEATVRGATAATGGPGAEVARLRGKLNDGSGARRAGVVLVSIGAGLILFFLALAIILRVLPVLSGGAAGLIPFAMGVGFLVDARLKKREFDRYTERGYFGAAPSREYQGQPMPPPPTSEMSAVQASDWRPLH